MQVFWVTTLLITIAMVMGAAASACAAPFTNGSFDSPPGLAPWTGIGDFSAGGTLAGEGPLSAPNQGIIQTQAGVYYGDLAAFLGTTDAAIEAVVVGFGPTNGSGIAQSWITGAGVNAQVGFGIVNVGDQSMNSALLIDNVSLASDGTLTFQWNFLTNEVGEFEGYNDTAFLVVNGLVIFLVDSVGIGPNDSVEPDFDGLTGWQNFSQQFPALQETPEPASLLAWGLVASVGAIFLSIRERSRRPRCYNGGIIVVAAAAFSRFVGS